MNILESSLYQCRIFHRRFKPKQHRLGYRAFYLMLDIDELDQMHRRLNWFSVNSFNIFSFYDRDHGPGADEPLRPWIEDQLSRADISLDGGHIRILCMPRILGYVFNPITVYFCYHKDGSIKAVMYEVNNTFGQRHSYLVAVKNGSAPLLKHSCDKRFFVSPFMEVAGQYHFSVKPPGDKLFIHIHQTDDEGALLDAWVKGNKARLSDLALLGTLTRYPLLTLKVIGGIHWEALKLWTKGIGIKNRPQPPIQPVTVVRDQSN